MCHIVIPTNSSYDVYGDRRAHLRPKDGGGGKGLGLSALVGDVLLTIINNYGTRSTKITVCILP